MVGAAGRLRAGTTDLRGATERARVEEREDVEGERARQDAHEVVAVHRQPAADEAARELHLPQPTVAEQVGEHGPTLGVGPHDELQTERTVLRWESDHVTKVLQTERTVLC